MGLRIACLGDNCIDRFLLPAGFALAGGNAVNVAVQVARLGHEAHYFGAAGADDAGQHIRGELLRNGVGIDGMVIDEGRPTAFTVVETRADGERRFVHEDFGACAAYRVDDAVLPRLASFDHVHIGWIDDGGNAKRRLLALRKSVSQDLSVNSKPENLSPEGLTIAFASADAGNAEACVRDLLCMGARLAVVTMGSAGSLAGNGRDLVRQQAFPVEPLDTTGAGDSYIAGFLVAHLLGGSLAESLAAGAARAKLACLHPGGFPQEPRRL